MRLLARGSGVSRPLDPLTPVLAWSWLLQRCVPGSTRRPWRVRIAESHSATLSTGLSAVRLCAARVVGTRGPYLARQAPNRAKMAF